MGCQRFSFGFISTCFFPMWLLQVGGYFKSTDTVTVSPQRGQTHALGIVPPLVPQSGVRRAQVGVVADAAPTSEASR